MTIKDIAKKCGVGVSTVSRALNNHPDINQETKEKILKAVEEDCFVPNNSARNLKRTDSKTIAIIVQDIDNPFFATMMKSMEREIRKEKYSFFIQHVGSRQNEVQAAMELVEEKRLRGIIFLGGYFEGQEAYLKRLKVPFVVSTAELPQTLEKVKTCSFVTIDNEEESRKITDYLCKKGHKRIAILAAAEDDKNIGKMRLAGYRKALAENNIVVRKELVARLEKKQTEYSMENGYRLTRRLLEEKVNFTAVYGISDLMAMGAARALIEAGKRVPEDCAVAGFDGLDYTLFYSPPITTIVQPVEEMAKESVEILFDMIAYKRKVPGRVIAAELAQRESS